MLFPNYQLLSPADRCGSHTLGRSIQNGRRVSQGGGNKRMECFEKSRLDSHPNPMPVQLMSLKSLNRIQSLLKVAELVWSNEISPNPEEVMVRVYCDVESHSQ